MLKIRRPLGRLIFNMWIAIPGKTVFLIETAPQSESMNQYQLACIFKKIYFCEPMVSKPIGSETKITLNLSTNTTASDMLIIIHLCKFRNMLLFFFPYRQSIVLFSTCWSKFKMSRLSSGLGALRINSRSDLWVSARLPRNGRYVAKTCWLSTMKNSIMNPSRYNLFRTKRRFIPGLTLMCIRSMKCRMSGPITFNSRRANASWVGTTRNKGALLLLCM